MRISAVKWQWEDIYLTVIFAPSARPLNTARAGEVWRPEEVHLRAVIFYVSRVTKAVEILN